MDRAACSLLGLQHDFGFQVGRLLSRFWLQRRREGGDGRPQSEMFLRAVCCLGLCRRSGCHAGHRRHLRARDVLRDRQSWRDTSRFNLFPVDGGDRRGLFHDCAPCGHAAFLSACGQILRGCELGPARSRDHRAILSQVVVPTYADGDGDDGDPRSSVDLHPGRFEDMGHPEGGDAFPGTRRSSDYWCLLFFSALD